MAVRLPYSIITTSPSSSVSKIANLLGLISHPYSYAQELGAVKQKPISLTNTNNILYSGLFLGSEIFTNWPYLMFSRENFRVSLRALSAY